MSSGRKIKVMIACVTFETFKIADPAEFYESNKVHLIHYVKDPVEDIIYGEFYDRTCELIRERLPKAKIIEHSESKVYEFDEMLREILFIIDTENAMNPDGCDIYVNISAGSPEYSAASAIASMMHPNVTPFSVRADSYTVPESMLKDMYYRDGKPVGMASSTREPKKIPTYRMPMPDERLVRGLRVFDEVYRANDGKVKSSKMVPELESAGLWVHRSKDDEKKSQTDAISYFRDFAKKWEGQGWILKGENGRYRITEEGRRIMDTFFTTEHFEPMRWER